MLRSFPFHFILFAAGEVVDMSIRDADRLNIFLEGLELPFLELNFILKNDHKGEFKKGAPAFEEGRQKGDADGNIKKRVG